MRFDDEFSGRVAVVTGGSYGLGYDFCKAMLAAGAQAWFCARDASRGRAAAESLGAGAHFVRADLSEPAQITAFAQAVRDGAGRVDYLVNNIAIDDRIDFADLSADVCDRMWNANLRSYLLTTRAFLDLLRAGQGRAIVNVCTTNYMLGLEPFTLYNATKSGIVGFTRSLARELGREGIRANTLSPGWIMTEKQLAKHVTEEDKRALLRDQSLKFLLTEEHVTPAAMFLLSSAARGVTGQNLVVDGGKFMQ